MSRFQYSTSNQEQVEYLYPRQRSNPHSNSCNKSFENQSDTFRSYCITSSKCARKSDPTVIGWNHAQHSLTRQHLPRVTLLTHFPHRHENESNDLARSVLGFLTSSMCSDDRRERRHDFPRFPESLEKGKIKKKKKTRSKPSRNSGQTVDEKVWAAL